MANFFRLHKSNYLYSVCLFILVLTTAIWIVASSSSAQSLVTVMKADDANQYEELHFTAEKGVEYTLQKSQDLLNWENDLSFIGTGQVVKLRLFALNNNVIPQNGNDAPFQTVSATIRKVDTGGTYVSWISLEDQTLKHAYLPTLELETNFPNSYIGLKNGYYLFLSLASPVSIIDPESAVAGKDLAFKNALSGLISVINNDTITSTPPIKPHRPPLTLGKEFWRINTNPYIDSDGDGATNQDEIADGTDIFDEDTDNNGIEDGEEKDIQDSDGDGVPDIDDADPFDKAITWKKIANAPYSLIPLEAPVGVNLSDGWHYDLGEGGHVLISDSTLDEWGGGNTAPAKTYFKTYVWDPSTSDWSTTLSQPDNIRGIGEAIDAEGNVYGSGTCATHPAVISAGAKYTSLRWAKNANGGWDAAVTEHETELIADFADAENSFTRMNSLYNQGLSDKDLFGLYGLFGKTGRFVISQKRLDHEDRSGYMQRVYSTDSNVGSPFALTNKDLEVSSYNAAGEPNGWHAITWVESSDTGLNNRYKFSKFTEISTLTDANPPTGNIRWDLKAIASIKPELLPTEIDVSDIVIWQSAIEGMQIGQRLDDSSNFTWQASTKTDASQRIGGQINGRGEAIRGDEIWRNGSWKNLSDYIPVEEWKYAVALDINSEGVILIQNPSSKEVALLAPIQFKEFEPYAGFDDYERLLDSQKLTRPWLAIPDTNKVIMLRDSTDAKLALATKFPEGKTSSVTPEESTQSPEALTITAAGWAGNNEFSFEGTLQVEGADALNLVAYKRRSLTIAVHVVSLLNDDIDQSGIKYKEGKPNAMCIRIGAGQPYLHTTVRGGDDQIATGGIDTGANGICETQADARDEQLIAVGKGEKNAEFIQPGPNNVLNTPVNEGVGRVVVGDDVVDGETINTGPNGIRDTPLVVPVQHPINAPTHAEIKAKLDAIFGKQANIYFNVKDLNVVSIAYDVGDQNNEYPNYTAMTQPNGMLDIFAVTKTLSPEETIVKAAAFDNTAHFNLYFLGSGLLKHYTFRGRVGYSSPAGFARAAVKMPYVVAHTFGADHPSSQLLCSAAAHELAHNDFYKPNTSLHHPRHPIRRNGKTIYEIFDAKNNYTLSTEEADRKRLLWPDYQVGGEFPHLLLKEECDRLHGLKFKK